MLKIISCGFEDLDEEEKELVPNNGSGTEYIKIIHNEKVILLESDAMEPEDATFGRDLNWIYEACRKCYEIGKQEA